MNKAVCLIDGFNIYHSLQDSKPELNYPYRQYKWLNLKKLAEIFLQPKDELREIYYFTSYCTWDINKVNRHKRYVYALKNEGIKVRTGKFKEIEHKCRGSCQETYKTNVEKRTDVQIAVRLLSLAYSDVFDNAYLMTADTDQIPAIEEINQIYKGKKKVYSIIPIDSVSEDFHGISKEVMKIREEHLAKAKFDLEIDSRLKIGRKISCPQEWR